MTADLKTILTGALALCGGVGGTIATQQGRVAKEVEEQTRERIRAEVLREMELERVKKDVEGLFYRVGQIETRGALEAYAKTQ